MAVLAGVFPAVSSSAGEAASPDYLVRAGDKLQISVWKETELQKEVIVSPDGKIAFPLTGEFLAAGRSVTAVRTEIEGRLKKYIPEPVVSVAVTSVGGNVAYVIGQVNKPGAIIMNPAVNVLQALSIAGGGTPFAKLDNTIIIRGSHGSQSALQFHYSQVSEGRRLEQNIQLESGDVVIVP
jgi:polysaccharide biosynthesis/export protein